MRKVWQFSLFIAVSGLLSSPLTLQAQTNLGSIAIGSSTNATVTVTISSQNVLSSIGVVTRGITGLEFVAAGTGTCMVGVKYDAGQTCTVGVTFKPTFAGPQFGAVVLHTTGTTGVEATGVLATEFVQGTGVGPQIEFNTANATAISPTLDGKPMYTFTALAVDGAGNLFLSAEETGGVYKIPAGSSAATFIPAEGTAGGSARSVSGVAIDGAGNIVMVGYPLAFEIPPGGGTGPEYSDNYQGGQSFVVSAAVDGAGDLFLLDSQGYGNVVEYPAGNPLATPVYTSTESTTYPVIDPYGLAVDPSGNIFVSDPNSSRVVEFPKGGGAPVLIAPVVNGVGLNSPTGLLSDSVGDLFICDANRIVEVPVVGAPLAIQPVVDGLTFTPQSIALDAAGNLFIVDTFNSRIIEVPRSQPPAVAFDSAPVGSTSGDSPKVVPIQNAGTAPLTFDTFDYPPDFTAQPSGADACATLTPYATGQICNLNVDFVPQSEGSLSGSVTLTDNNLGKPGAQQKVSVSGGIEPLLSATSLSYGTVVEGYPSPSQQVTLTNTTPSPLAIVGIHVTGPDAPSFIFGSTCPASLAVGDSCIIHGHYNPIQSAQVDSATVIITYRGVPSQSIFLSGQYILGPTTYYSTNNLSYGDQQVGTQSISQSVTLKNQGGSDLHIFGFHVTGPDASSFIFGTDCPAALAPPNFCTIHGHFAPTKTGPLTAIITINDDGGNIPTARVQTITLSGTGTAQPATISISPSSLSYGNEPLGSSTASQSVFLTNTGTSTLDIKTIAITGPNASSFIFGNDCPPTLAPEAYCTIHGHFAPTSAGTLTAAITLVDTAANSPQAIPLSGTGQ